MLRGSSPCCLDAMVDLCLHCFVEADGLPGKLDGATVWEYFDVHALNCGCLRSCSAGASAEVGEDLGLARLQLQSVPAGGCDDVVEHDGQLG